ncbi:MAG: hypothetical protein IT578_08005 [Verrucomicrobiae bacterium]|nr:hypothetical protein [Verrucomicrobiae bacterium]
MSERQETTLFVASPDGTAMEPLPRSELRRRLDACLLRWTQQIWCPEEGKWKSAREIPRLGSESATTPKAAVAAAPKPVVVKKPSAVQSSVQPRIAVARPISETRVAAKAHPIPTAVASPALKPAVPSSSSSPAPASARAPSAVLVARTPSVVKASSASRAAPSLKAAKGVSSSPSVPRAEGAPRKTWRHRNSLFYGAGCVLILLALAGMNWLGAAAPARRAVADVGLSGKAVVIAHCGFYVQPGALVLDFAQLPDDLSPEKFIDLLTALATRNPTSTLFWSKYDSVALAKDGTVRFRLRGDAWEALAKMRTEVAGRRAPMLVDYLYDATGKAVLDQKEDRMEYLQGQREKALREFLGTFVRLENPARPRAASPSEKAPAPSEP